MMRVEAAFRKWLANRHEVLDSNLRYAKKKEKVKQNNKEQPQGKIFVKNTDANKIIMQIISKSVTNGKAEGIR